MWNASTLEQQLIGQGEVSSASDSCLTVLNLGRLDYAVCYSLQQQVVAQRIKGVIGDTLLLVEHSPVYTIGRNGTTGHLLARPEWLAEQGITVYQVDRGGDITYHGPGQVVAYPILDLHRHRQDLHWVIHSYEEAVLRLLIDLGLEGHRLPQYPGVWVGQRKVAAIGIGVRQWVTYHGLALNLNPCLGHFQGIVPCGIRDLGVASLDDLLAGVVPNWEETAGCLARHLAEVLGLHPLAGTLPPGPQVKRLPKEEKKCQRIFPPG